MQQFLILIFFIVLKNSVLASNFTCSNGEVVPYIDICNGFSDCSDKSDETEHLCTDIICPPETFQCDYGACIDEKKKCNGKFDCSDNSDEADKICATDAGKFCPPIISKRFVLKCELHDKIVSCDKDVKPGTNVEYSCAEHFEPKRFKFSGKATCQSTGNWSSEISQCVPKCGNLDSAVPLIVNGLETNTPFPWHVTMFLRKHNQWNFACGGSLITENLVLSASHCFTDTPESDIIFFIGKIHNNFTIIDDEKNAKLFGVKKVIRHPLYLDKIGNYGSDIAIILLNETVELNEFVHPVCLDWDVLEILNHLKAGSLGVATGMGITENDVNSKNLRIVKLPVVSNRKCIDQEPQDFKKYVRMTTFCAGWNNGTSLCNGDSGGGFVFKSRIHGEDKWYIQGVVSLSPRRDSTFFCDPTKYTVFTKVGLYIKWMRKVLAHIHSPYHSDTNYSYEPIL